MSITIFSHGPNLPLFFRLSEDPNLDTNHNYCVHHFLQPEGLQKDDCLYLFRKVTTFTGSKWVIKTDLSDCLHEALAYHYSDSCYEEDVIVYIIHDHSVSMDSDQISISHLLKTPGQYITDWYMNYRKNSENMTEKEAIKESIHMWNLFHKEELVIIRNYLQKYSQFAFTFLQKLAESKLFIDYCQDENNIPRTLDEIIMMIRSCQAWCNDEKLYLQEKLDTVLQETFSFHLIVFIHNLILKNNNIITNNGL